MEASPDHVYFIDRSTPDGEQHEMITGGLGVA